MKKSELKELIKKELIREKSKEEEERIEKYKEAKRYNMDVMRFEKITKANQNDAIKLVYQWCKTGTIGLKEFTGVIDLLFK